MSTSGNPEEDRRRSELVGILKHEFIVYEEVWLRHALFRHRLVRADVLAIPRVEQFSHCALAFEVKGHEEWDIPKLSKSLKQASDYVLATVEPQEGVDRIHWWKRIMAAFVYPAPDGDGRLHDADDPRTAFLLGMIQASGSHRVGAARESRSYKERPLVLTVAGSEIWVSSRGWRADAGNLLSGKRQIGSQKFSILEELAKTATDAEIFQNRSKST